MPAHLASVSHRSCSAVASLVICSEISSGAVLSWGLTWETKNPPAEPRGPLARAASRAAGAPLRRYVPQGGLERRFKHVCIVPDTTPPGQVRRRRGTRRPRPGSSHDAVDAPGQDGEDVLCCHHDDDQCV